MISLRQGATPAQCRQYLDLQIEVLGEDKGIDKIYLQGRYGKLIEPVSSALGNKSADVRWDDGDDGFKVIRPGIDPVAWLNEKIVGGLDDAQIIAAAENA